MKYLPQLLHPHVAILEWVQEIREINDELQRLPFADGRICVPFYIFLKINSMEGAGSVHVVFFQEDRENLAVSLGERLLASKFGPELPDSRHHVQTDDLFLRFAAARAACALKCSSGIAAMTLGGDIRIYRRAAGLQFEYGEPNQYYHHIIFMDRITDLERGTYGYAIFLNNHPLRTGRITVTDQER